MRRPRQYPSKCVYRCGHEIVRLFVKRGPAVRHMDCLCSSCSSDWRRNHELQARPSHDWLPSPEQIHEEARRILLENVRAAGARFEPVECYH